MNALHTGDHHGILECFRAAAITAGEIASGYFRPGSRTTAGISYKDGNSPVSEADMAVDRFLKDQLRAAVPEAAWLSEETADSAERLGRETVLVVDPIDGTRAFIGGDSRWCVSIALVTAGRPVVGVVHAPALGQRFEAVAGGGATLNGATIAVSTRHSLAGAQIAAPTNLLPHEPEAPFRIVPRIPSLACRFVHVAAGFIDAGLAIADSHDWDIAAADLIVLEAGGLFTDRFGSTLRYNQPHPTHPVLVSGPPGVHHAILDLLRPLGD